MDQPIPLWVWIAFVWWWLGVAIMLGASRRHR